MVQTYQEQIRELRNARAIEYTRMYNRTMLIWGIANLLVIIIGTIGYLYYQPLHIEIEPDDFFGAVGSIGIISSILQALIGGAGHPHWMCW